MHSQITPEGDVAPALDPYVARALDPERPFGMPTLDEIVATTLSFHERMHSKPTAPAHNGLYDINNLGREKLGDLLTLQHEIGAELATRR